MIDDESRVADDSEVARRRFNTPPARTKSERKRLASRLHSDAEFLKANSDEAGADAAADLLEVARAIREMLETVDRYMDRSNHQISAIIGLSRPESEGGERAHTSTSSAGAEPDQPPREADED